MAGQLQLLDLAQSKNLSLENVETIGVAGDFLVINYSDGVVVLRHSRDVGSAQFTPYAENNGDEGNQEAAQTNGQVSNN